MIKINKEKVSPIIWLILTFTIPTILATNYVANQYYVSGTGVYDVGWFTYLLTESNTWPILNPGMMTKPSFFSTHFSIFYYLTTYIYSFIKNYIPPAIYFSFFIGSMYGLLASSVFIAGKSLLPNKINFYFILFIISLITSMNGPAMGLIGFPHVEIAIPALVLLFLSLYFTKKNKLSYIVFVFLLLIREDAGFHIFSILSVVVFSLFFIYKKTPPCDLIVLCIISFLYSILCIYIQKTYYPGDNALERIYLGSPHFAHINIDNIIKKCVFLGTNREYIFIPIILTFILSIIKKNILFLTALIAYMPWLILSIVAINNMPSSLSNYYAFPFITLVSWPVFFYAISNYFSLLHTLNYRDIYISILLITGTSVALFPGNVGNFDASPWRRVGFNYISRISNTEKIVSYINQNKTIFGEILFDEPMAALFIKTIQLKEYGYINTFSNDLMNKADTVVFTKKHTPLNNKAINVMRKIITDNELTNIYIVKDTDIIIATKIKVIKHSLLDTFDRLFFTKYSGANLQSRIGEIVKDSMIAGNSINKEGYLTYGPYIRLPVGRYNFNISYSSSEDSESKVGIWDVALVLTDEILVLKKGNIFGTNGNISNINGHFDINEKYSDIPIEIRSYYKNIGVLSINELEIKPENLDSTPVNTPGF